MVIQRTLFLAFFIAWTVRLDWGWLHSTQSGGAAWVQVFFLVTALATTLASLACGLPWQNVLAVAAIFGLAGAAGESLWEILTRGLISAVSNGGSRLAAAQETAWKRALQWVIIVINARGMARLAFRRWRGLRFFGLWVIVTAALLSSALIVAWNAMDNPPPQAVALGTVALHAGGAVLVSLGLLVAATPWLINKKPVPTPLEFQPFFLWALFVVLSWGCLPFRQNWPQLYVLTLLSLPALIPALGSRHWAADPY
jgi:hypothetical protein